MKLDLGSGPRPREGFTGVDVCEAPEVVRCDLALGMLWPFEDSSVDELFSSHFIEHIPAENVLVEEKNDAPEGWKHKDALFFFFDECYRVAKPGARFTIVWPALKSSAAFQDPTHRRFLPLEFTHYLSREGRKALRVEQYNVSCDWIVEDSQLRVTNPKDFGREDAWTGAEINGVWDVQREWVVVMRRGP